MLSDTEMRLKAWGRSARAHRIENYSTPLQVLISQNASSSPSCPGISDDEFLKIDGAVARLKFRSPEMGKAIFLYFVVDFSERELAKQLGVGREKAKVYLSSGISWIDSRLEYLDGVCEVA